MIKLISKKPHVFILLIVGCYLTAWGIPIVAEASARVKLVPAVFAVLAVLALLLKKRFAIGEAALVISFALILATIGTISAHDQELPVIGMFAGITAILSALLLYVPGKSAYSGKVSIQTRPPG